MIYIYRMKKLSKFLKFITAVSLQNKQIIKQRNSTLVWSFILAIEKDKFRKLVAAVIGCLLLYYQQHNDYLPGFIKFSSIHSTVYNGAKMTCPLAVFKSVT